jgi:hypothetical protein
LIALYWRINGVENSSMGMANPGCTGGVSHGRSPMDSVGVQKSDPAVALKAIMAFSRACVVRAFLL